MSKSNNTRNQNYLSKINNWKRKAVNRRIENELLKKRQKEILLSRAHWKSKYKEKKVELFELEKAYSKLLKNNVDFNKSDEKIKHHSYTSKVILFFIWLRSSSTSSLRSCRKTLEILMLIYGLEFDIKKLPSISTIQNWEKKFGYYRLYEKPLDKEEKWVLILDESICIGRDKLLLQIGVPLSKYSCGKALKMKDIRVLSIEIGNSWKGKAISQTIRQMEQLGLSFSYAVSDGGLNLCNGLEECKISRIADCTHVLGKILENRYKKNEVYLSFVKRCNLLKKQIVLSDAAAIMPPSLRTKGKFLNLYDLSDWSIKAFKLIKQAHIPSKSSKSSKGLDENMYKRVEWILDYETFIYSLHSQCKLLKQVQKLLKHEGLSAESQKKCETLIEQVNIISQEFGDNIKGYIKENMMIVEELFKEQKIDDPIVICCSDIIESIFGKYKYQLKQGANIITDNCLTIANFSETFSEEEVKNAMEKVKIVDLQEWKNKNCQNNFKNKKRRLFKNTA